MNIGELRGQSHIAIAKIRECDGCGGTHESQINSSAGKLKRDGYPFWFVCESRRTAVLIDDKQASVMFEGIQIWR